MLWAQNSIEEFDEWSILYSLIYQSTASNVRNTQQKQSELHDKNLFVYRVADSSIEHAHIIESLHYAKENPDIINW